MALIQCFESRYDVEKIFIYAGLPHLVETACEILGQFVDIVRHLEKTLHIETRIGQSPVDPARPPRLPSVRCRTDGPTLCPENQLALRPRE